MIQALLLAFALLFAPVLAQAQFVIGDGAPPVPSVAVQSAMEAGKIYIDLDSLKKPRQAFSEQRLAIVCTGTIAACLAAGGETVPNRYTGGGGFGANNSGSFRVSCTFSHVAFDDPIVYPGESGRTHLHQFFGNTKTRAVTNLDDMAVSGDSTCAGGTLNRTGYWAPTLVFYCPNNDCPPGRNHGQVLVSSSANFYYKCALSGNCATGGFGGTPLQWWPRGMRIIAGDPSGKNPSTVGKIVWRCNYDHFRPDATGGGDLELYRGGSIPSTVIPRCNDLEITIDFPTCWDGVNTDSPGNHNAHVAFTNYGSPACNNPLFPVLTPELALNIHTDVNPVDVPFLRLSSDPPPGGTQLAGHSAHADWVNGWDQTTILPFGKTVTEAIMQECYMMFYTPSPLHSDCHNHLLGDPAKINQWWRML